MSDNEDDDIPQLSADTFNALQEFYKEQEERENRKFDNSVQEGPIEENWQLSQFWYDQNTIDKLVEIILKTTDSQSKIALISCPTLYSTLKEKASDQIEITLYEYDRRFSCYGKDYVYYDYKAPLDIPRDKSSYYDIVVADPPFLSDECLTKTAVTIRFLTKQKILLCTGTVMEDMASRLLDLRKNTFKPKHKNNLANEFSCYSNFNVDELL